MAANVLTSETAIEMSVVIVRAFVTLRRMALSVEGLARKVEGLEKKYDKQFHIVFDAIRQLILEPETKRSLCCESTACSARACEGELF
jgi:hypothetical protein